MTERSTPGHELSTKIEASALPQFRVILDIPPTKDFYVTELNCLPLGPLARNALIRAGLTNIRDLLGMSREEIDSKRQIGAATLGRICPALEEFRQRITAEAARNPGQPVVVTLSSEIKAAVAAGKTPHQIEQIYGVWSETTRRLTGEESTPKSPREKVGRNKEIVNLVKFGCTYNDAARIAAKEFGESKPVSRQRVQQIIKRELERQGS